jgi:hypothetical protein
MLWTHFSILIIKWERDDNEHRGCMKNLLCILFCPSSRSEIFFYFTLGCFGRSFVLGFLFSSLEDFGSSRFLQQPRSSFPHARSICVALFSCRRSRKCSPVLDSGPRTIALTPVRSSLGFPLRQTCLPCAWFVFSRSNPFPGLVFATKQFGFWPCNTVCHRLFHLFLRFSSTRSSVLALVGFFSCWQFSFLVASILPCPAVPWVQELLPDRFSCSHFLAGQVFSVQFSVFSGWSSFPVSVFGLPLLALISPVQRCFPRQGACSRQSCAPESVLGCRCCGSLCSRACFWLIRFLFSCCRLWFPFWWWFLHLEADPILKPLDKRFEFFSISSCFVRVFFIMHIRCSIKYVWDSSSDFGHWFDNIFLLSHLLHRQLALRWP